MQLAVLFVTKGRVTGRKDGTQRKEEIWGKTENDASVNFSHTNPS